MTVATTDTLVIHRGNGSAVNFPYTFRIPDPTFVSVYLRDYDTKVVTLVLDPSDYTITGANWANYNGGIVTYNPGTPLSSDFEIVIERNPSFLQGLNLENQGGFYADSQEQAFDLLTMQTQFLLDRSGRAIQVPAGEDSIQLPGISERANKVAGWGAEDDGAPFIALDSDALNPMSGNGPPDPDLGIVGSVYYDVSDYPDQLTFYGPKTESGWGAGLPLRGDTGEPGANVMALPSFEFVDGTDIPLEVDLVQTSSYWASRNDGGALYVPDGTVTAAFRADNPYTTFASADGRGWRLASVPRLDFAAVGIIYDASSPAIENSKRLQAALWWGYKVFGGGILRPQAWHLRGQIFIDKSMIPIYYTGPEGHSSFKTSNIEGVNNTVSQIICITDNTNTKPMLSIPACYADGETDYLYRGGIKANFTSGGTTAIAAGDTVTGATSGAKSRVLAVVLTSGSWAGGDAAGYLMLQDMYAGNFVAENLNVGTNLNLATLSGTPTDRQLMPAGTGSAQSTRIWNNLGLNCGSGKWAYCVYTCNSQSERITNINYAFHWRGELQAGGFDSVYDTVYFNGVYFNGTRTIDECQNDFKNSFGLHVNGHAKINNIAGSGCGTILCANGPGTSIHTTRLEVSECAVRFGGKNYFPDQWDGVSSYGVAIGFYGTISDFATESCRWGLWLENTGGTFKRGRITGTAGAVPGIGGPSRAPMCACYIDASVTTAYFEQVEFITGTNLGGRQVLNLSSGGAKFFECTSDTVGGLNYAFSGTDMVPYRMIHQLVNPSVNLTASIERRRNTYFGDLRLRGIQDLDIRGVQTPVRNLNQSVTVLDGANTATVTFQTSVSSGVSAFTVAPAASGTGNTLPTDTYYYYTTLFGPKGETGVGGTELYPVPQDNTFTATDNAKSVAVTLGQKVTMSFAASSANFKRRVYRAKLSGLGPGYIEGYWELAGTATTFEDTGAVAFDGIDIPSKFGIIPSQVELDANYNLFFGFQGSGWNAGFIWPTSVATTGFTVNVETAPTGDKKLEWLMTRSAL